MINVLKVFFFIIIFLLGFLESFKYVSLSFDDEVLSFMLLWGADLRLVDLELDLEDGDLDEDLDEDLDNEESDFSSLSTIIL